MSAEMHIHIDTGLDDAVFRCHLNNYLGSQYCGLWSQVDNYGRCLEQDGNYACWHSHVVIETPDVLIGDVSWLKAMFLPPEDGGESEYVPSTIGRISELLDEQPVANPAVDPVSFPTITPELIEEVDRAFDLPNESVYPIEGKRDEVRAFLTEHIGKRAFCISW